MLAVGQAEKTDLIAFKKLLDDNLARGLAQQLSAEQALSGFNRDMARRADDDPLAGGQSVGLDHDRSMKNFDSLVEFGGGHADSIVGRRNIVPLQEALGEGLAALQHGSSAGGPKDAQATLLQSIHNAER